MRITEDLRIAQARLQGAAWGTVAVVLLSLTLKLPRAHATLIAENLALLAIAIPIAFAARRGAISTLAVINACGAAIAGPLALITITACAIEHQLLFVAMLASQFVAASALFFSTLWLVIYLAVAALGAIAMLVATGFDAEGVLVATTAVLSVTIHVAIRDRQRRRDSAYAAQLEAALDLACSQLRAKEVAEAEREAAQIETARYQDQLLQAQKMDAIGTLAGGMAHDMNNALAGILGVAECLREAAPTEEVRADAEQIVQAAERAADLTRNLLTFSRRGRYRSERLDARALIGSVVTLLRRTLPKGITVQTSFAPELAAFDGDPSLLSHALVNLCINASDAMTGHGVLELGARVVDYSDAAASALELVPGRHLVLSVSDTGTGIDDATRARIFEPFFTTKEAGRGTGLGLAMVYGTVKRHHGAIEVDSTLGRGTTFRLCLPVATGAEPQSLLRTATVPIAVQRDGRILVVDDEPLVRGVVQRVLQSVGYTVVVAADGVDGLATLARAGAAFDLVLLDMAMPRMAGPEAFHAIRAAHAAQRILLMSGYSSLEGIRALLDAGALDLIEKPFAPSRLLDAVGRALRDRPTASAQAAAPA